MFSKFLLFLSLISFVTSYFHCNPYQGCINFKELSALTFINGQKTTDFKGNTYPKIECTGNIEDCKKIISVQCKNKGVSDSGNINWKCDYQFLHNSHIKVIEDYPSCIGYRFQGDPDYILKGSCIMKVTVTNTYQYDQIFFLKNGNIGKESEDSIFVIALLIIAIFPLLIIIISSNSNTTTYTRTYHDYYQPPQRSYWYNYNQPYYSQHRANSNYTNIPGKNKQTTFCESKNR